MVVMKVVRVRRFVANCALAVLMLCGLQSAVRAAEAGEGRFGRGLRPGETFVAAPPLGAMYFTVPRTVECWAKIGNANEDTPILGYEPRTSIEHWALYAAKGSGALSAYLTGYKPQTVTSSQGIADWKWHYLAMTFDGTTLRLFVDAKPVAEQKMVKIHGWSDMGPLTFGHVPGMAAAKDLQLDEVRLSRGVRAIERVPDGPFSADADTVGLWHFDEADGTAGYADSSANHNKARPATADEEFSLQSPQSTNWQKEDHGPFFSSSMSSSEPARNETNKGVSVRLGADGKAGVCFDTELLRVSAAWTGGFMRIYPGRDGLGQHPDADGTVEFGCAATPGWGKGAESADFADPRPDKLGPLPAERGHYKGLYLHGQRVVLSYSVFGTDVLESFDLESRDGEHAFARPIEVGPAKDALTMVACEKGLGSAKSNGSGARVSLDGVDGRCLDAALITAADTTGVSLAAASPGPGIDVRIAPHTGTVRFKVLVWTGRADARPKFDAMVAASQPPPDLAALTHGGPARWEPAVVTKGELGTEKGPYVVDTLTAPDDNPWKSYLRFSGVDFFKNGAAAICSISGDVWVVSGIDESLAHLKWKRFATGLFQPLGLRIVDDVVYVLGRDQITRLHDLNGDGEADFYENFNNDCKVTTGAHEFATCLQTDPQGNFYYTKCGNPTEDGGTMLEVSKDGSKLTVFAVGLRNPNGMCVGPTGIVTTSDNEGEWVPASRVDFVHKGQFLGFTPMAHGPTPGDPGFPIWIPHAIDNSSGGQVWVEGDRWGSLQGQLLHTSYGASSLHLMLPEIVDGKLQGGSFKFPLKFATGIMRARFNPADGQLYVCGLKGWQTNGIRDGAFQRVRFTGAAGGKGAAGKLAAIPCELHAYQNGIRIGFTSALDPKTAGDLDSWGVSQWNYRWTSDYGSRDWSVAEPKRQGHDTVEVKSVRLSKDHKSVFLEIPGIKPVMQMEIQYNIDTADGASIEQEIYNTIHALRPAMAAEDLEKPVARGW
jgi:hypothetical protein